MDNSLFQWIRLLILIILGYEGAGALLGGLLLIIKPDGQLMDMPTELLNGVFPNFLIPGIILFVLGIITSYAFVMVWRRKPLDWFWAGLAMGGFLVWFIVEIIIIQELHWLHLMWGLPVVIGSIFTIGLIYFRHPTEETQSVLLLCGVWSSLWYIGINIYVPARDASYSIASFTVSELSAIGAPTRIIWVLLVLGYLLLFGAFAWGVLFSAKENRYLRWVGILMLIYCLFNAFWPPMHLRGQEPTLTDTLHILWAVITNIFMWLFMGLGAVTLGRRFIIYTLISIALHLVFGWLTFKEAVNIPSNSPTPLIGIWERINILIFMVWVIIFALLLRNRQIPISLKAQT